MKEWLSVTMILGEKKLRVTCIRWSKKHSLLFFCTILLIKLFCILYMVSNYINQCDKMQLTKNTTKTYLAIVDFKKGNKRVYIWMLPQEGEDILGCDRQELRCDLVMKSDQIRSDQIRCANAGCTCQSPYLRKHKSPWSCSGSFRKNPLPSSKVVRKRFINNSNTHTHRFTND